MRFQTNIIFPPNFKFLCCKNTKNNQKTFFVYDNSYFYKFGVDKYFLMQEINGVVLLTNSLDNNKKHINFFLKFMKSLNCYFYIKIKFKGKGYKIRYSKRKKRIKFFFGRSHITIIKYKNVILKKNSKYKFIIKSNSLERVKRNAIITTNVKPLNIFTLRGIRKSRSIIFKRKGKKGSYI